MKTVTNETAPVNSGEAAGDELVEIEFSVPTWVWEAIKEESRAEGITTDDVVTRALEEHFQHPRPEGTLPMFFDERMVRYTREFCLAAKIDPDDWAGAWIQVHFQYLTEIAQRPDGSWRLNGIMEDIVDGYEFDEATTDETITKEDAIKAMLEVFERYKAELAADEPQPALAMEGGAE